LEETGLTEKARIYWDSLAMVVEERPPQGWRSMAATALIYQGLGEKEASIQAAEDLVSLKGAEHEGAVEDRFHNGPNAQLILARVLAHFGEHDRAVDILEEALPAPSWLTVHILEIDPIWDPLRDHPRFQALLEEYRDDGVPRRR
jgi:serine/threonine-protein kinase